MRQAPGVIAQKAVKAHHLFADVVHGAKRAFASCGRAAISSMPAPGAASSAAQIEAQTSGFSPALARMNPAAAQMRPSCRARQLRRAAERAVVELEKLRHMHKRQLPFPVRVQKLHNGIFLARPGQAKVKLARHWPAFWRTRAIMSPTVRTPRMSARPLQAELGPQGRKQVNLFQAVPLFYVIRPGGGGEGDGAVVKIFAENFFQFLQSSASVMVFPPWVGWKVHRNAPALRRIGGGNVIAVFGPLGVSPAAAKPSEG